jgi:type II secretory pathway component GspD/PulD (secretin)
MILLPHPVTVIKSWRSSFPHQPLQKVARRGFSLLLAVGVLVGPLSPMSILAGWSQTLDPSYNASGQSSNPGLYPTHTFKPVRGEVSISRDVKIVQNDEKVSINLRDASIRDVLNTLAQQGNFNLILDESVQGNLTIDIKNISINKALEYLFTVSQLSYTKDGNTVIVASREQADAKNLNAKTLKAIPVLYKDASRVASTLNNTVFKVARPGGSTTALVSFDVDSNSLLVMGTESDIKLVSDTLRQLDVPRNRKVYPIVHNTPAYVASVLAANFFQTNTAAGGGGGTAGAGGGASAVGAGAATGGGAGATAGAAGGGGAGGAAGGAAGGTTGTGGALTTFTTSGVTFIAEPIASTLTVLGTDEQLALIDSIIAQVDVRRPQAEIEVSLVEIQNSDLKNFKPLWGRIFLGAKTALTLNQLDGTGNPTGVSVLDFVKNNTAQRSVVSTFSLSQSNQNIKGKVLANPTIVALDGQTSTITITDQVPNISQNITQSNVGGPVVTTTITTQDAGITLRLTPTISNDGSVVLNLQPDVSQPTRIVSSGGVSTTLISKRTLTLGGVRVTDGQTLVIGGLLREGERLDVNRVPGLDKLPIISAMFRTINSNDKDKTELVLMVTPHILREDAVTYFTNGSGSPPGPSIPPANHTADFHPVSLPRFTGSPIKADPSIPLRPSDPSVSP